ncbi:MAG: hypothetical protein GXW90_09220 [Tepidanaerobacter acetatoxydans]|uniref:hypothetical protein n=2 Tax=Tepidanaerobacter TaxID=499228 RepID=UPI0026F02364|nr:hypothetical protein [Tepidanaerobacter acetatoxydans]NLU11092.1 hypothetical protein [Tepidanaerobacter acetatoxydans]
MYRHFKRMTDSTGIIQFSDISNPLIESGYTVDDNARALIVAIGMEELEREKLIKTFISFLQEAQMPDGTWQNLKVHDKYYTLINSEDSVGRGILAASFAADCDIPETKDTACKMLKKVLPKAIDTNSPRAMSYTLLGMVKLIDSLERISLLPYAKHIAYKLIKLYDANRCKDWHWFEDRLTYCNALLPHALFGFYVVSKDVKALKVAKITLNFLTDSLFKKGYLNIVGNQGWWIKKSQIPPYDQQPVDAASIALACLQAFVVTGEREYIEMAQLAYDWYWGKNLNNLPLYNEETQGCHDALVPHGVNLNQGAEAVISFLMAHQVLQNIKEKKQRILIPAV